MKRVMLGATLFEMCEVSDHRPRGLRLGHVDQYVWIFVNFILKDFQTAFPILWL